METCIHEWELLDKLTAMEPHRDCNGLFEFTGEEYRFYCKKCAEITNKIIRFNTGHEKWVFNPFAKEKTSEEKLLKISWENLINFVLGRFLDNLPKKL